MVIGIDASRANRSHKSGTEWYSYYLIRALAKIDSKNQYLLYSDKPLTGGLVDLTDDEARDQAQDIKIDQHGFQEIKSYHNNFKAKILKWPYQFFWTQGRLSLEMIFNAPDMLFIPAHTLPLIHPKKSIVTIHDIGFERDENLYGRDEMGPTGTRARKLVNWLIRFASRGKYGANSRDYLRWSTKFALKQAASIITISEFSKKEIMDVYAADGNKINVVYNGFNDKLYTKSADDEKIKSILSKYGIERPYVLYVGRLDKKKNTPALVEAFALMREENKNIKHRLLLTGDAHFGYDEVKYAIKEWQMEEEILMTGWIEEEDMPYLYNGATAFVFPSLYEGFGIPMVQAMACGVPVIASDYASIPEVVSGAAYLFDPSDIKSIAEALARILLDGKLREDLIGLGFKRARDFNWDKCAEGTLKVMEKT